MKYILEYGINFYKIFNTIKEAQDFRKSINSNGYIWTEDGHLVKEYEYS